MSVCPMNSSISTANFQGIYDCFVQTGILDIAGLWNTGGTLYNYLNYTYTVNMIGTTSAWFSLYVGVNSQYVLYGTVWAVLFVFWASLYAMAVGAKIYNDSVYNFTWPNENQGGSIIEPTRDALGL